MRAALAAWWVEGHATCRGYACGVGVWWVWVGEYRGRHAHTHTINACSRPHTGGGAARRRQAAAIGDIVSAHKAAVVETAAAVLWLSCCAFCGASYRRHRLLCVDQAYCSYSPRGSKCSGCDQGCCQWLCIANCYCLKILYKLGGGPKKYRKFPGPYADLPGFSIENGASSWSWHESGLLAMSPTQPQHP